MQEAEINVITAASAWRGEASILLATVLQGGKGDFAALKLMNARPRLA